MLNITLQEVSGEEGNSQPPHIQECLNVIIGTQEQKFWVRVGGSPNMTKSWVLPQMFVRSTNLDFDHCR